MLHLVLHFLHNRGAQIEPVGEASGFDDEESWPYRARLAAQYVIGIVLLDRDCWVEQFTAERVADPQWPSSLPTASLFTPLTLSATGLLTFIAICATGRPQSAT